MDYRTPVYLPFWRRHFMFYHQSFPLWKFPERFEIYIKQYPFTIPIVLTQRNIEVFKCLRVFSRHGIHTGKVKIMSFMPISFNQSHLIADPFFKITADDLSE